MSKPQAMHDTSALRTPADGPMLREDSRADRVGWAVFAAVMLMMAGAFNAIDGLVALLNGKWLADNTSLPVTFDYTTWGWTWLIFGAVVVVAGIGVLGGRTWARIVGIVFAALNATVQLLFIPAYPFWSMTVIAVDVIVIWALATRAGELRE